MQDFTRHRVAETLDEIWLVEHPPVYTQGLSCRARPAATWPSAIPVVATDRGGQITYHGPGQVVAYVLMDVRGRGWGPKRLVNRIEQAVIDVLAAHAISGTRRDGAPGVYVGDAKIAALGLRLTRGASYHGVSLNVNLDLAPFEHIDPCGYPGLRVTRMCDLGVTRSTSEIARSLGAALVSSLDYRWSWRMRASGPAQPAEPGVAAATA